jgi:UDP-hydrolysing UDP-N-acetyl-D-glucosamine 2-epimerase
LDPRFCVVDDNSGIVFVQGDRTELLPALESAVRDNAVIAHAAGGERTKGSTDDRVRDAVTKLAHLHYPVHEQARTRLMAMGEEDWRVCVSGEIGVDTIMGMGDVPLPAGIEPRRGDWIVALHPVTSRPDETKWALGVISMFSSLNAPKMWLVSPNGDPGSEAIEQAWDAYCMVGLGHRLGSLTHQQFLTVMRRCGTIIGNSSCLITEAPHVGCLPILIGTRQEGRMPAPSDGNACGKILDHMAANIGRPLLKFKA